MNLTEIKTKARAQVRPVVLVLDRLGLSPLAVSLAGLFITALAGWLVGRGQLFFGALIFLVGSAFDMLDGDLARMQGKVSRRGAFLDSCFDRISEAFVFAGLTWYYAGLPAGDRWPLVFLMGTAVGSLATSYVKARAEGLGQTCQVGFLQRTERVVILTVGMLLGRWILGPILVFMTVATLGTTLQRIVHVAGKLASEGDPE